MDVDEGGTEGNDAPKQQQESSRKKDFFFHDRYTAHDFGETYARTKMRDCDRTVQKLIAKVRTLSPTDTNVLFNVQATIIESRRFLKNSYVLTYQLQDSDHLRIIQTQQGVLENFVERLSFLSELQDVLVYSHTSESEHDVYQHLRMMSFYTTSVRKFMQRVQDTCNSVPSFR